MGLTEFQLIDRYFSGCSASPGLVLGTGDDAALIRPRADRELAVCMDTLVSGVHFPADAPAVTVGHKSLAVNLSDLAAMGAEPRWALLALTIPSADEEWLAAFSAGFLALAKTFGIQLIGGDTTRGTLTITVQAMGELEPGTALRRSGARVGDDVYVTGTLGDAALGLRLWQAGEAPLEGARARLVDRLNRPTPRVALGRRLRGLATAAIDISDGLCADLGHVLEASGVGATIETGRLPLSDEFRRLCPAGRGLALASRGGDDYELCFTAPVSAREAIETVSEAEGVSASIIGTVEPAPGLRAVDEHGARVRLDGGGFDHFSSVD